MATNKWLNDLQILKSTTDILRTTLRNKNVRALDTDTLPTLVSKVPDLAPIVESEGDKWQPDELWKFPDPNGTDTLKTIREIYDEDTLASSYTYRGIFQIRSNSDIIDLKEMMSKRTNADTFILSDGTTYENITATTLEHTWDKTKDVIDSKGNRQRYVRIYTKTQYQYIPSTHYGDNIWFIYNFYTSIPGSSYITDYGSSLECMEFGDKVTTLSSSANYYINNSAAKKIVADNAISLDTGSYSSNAYFCNQSLKELDIKFSKINISNTNIIFNSYIKYIDLDKYNSSILIMTAQPSALCAIEYFKNMNPIIKTIKLRYSNLNNLDIVSDLEELTITYCYKLKSLIIPYAIKKLDIEYMYALEDLIINAMPVTSVYFSSLYKLKNLTVPLDWNFSVSLSSSSYLTHDSIIGLLNNLKDLTGDTAKTITLGSTNLAKLTDEEKAIATNKNWTLA